jgi:site-specific DNA-methyltransferase (adenine-specific)
MSEQLLHGNCLDRLKELEENSIDAIVTDPPYGLSFMGKKWDYEVPSQEIWSECLRVLKPGGYLLAFAGTRTQHRMAVRIEDAGFEIRDMIAWVYGSGFPKSLNIGKAINKIDGVEFDEIPASGVGFMNAEGEGGYNVTKNQLIQKGESSERAKEWEGWGTALKPALEPITVARKPLSEKTVAENVLKWGTGGINIDASRVEGEPTPINRLKNWSGFGQEQKPDYEATINTTGRFPANFIHDGSDEVIELLNDSARFFYVAKTSKSERNRGCEGLPLGEAPASARSKPAEGRENALGNPRANNHPTVKPIALMEYLVKLVSKEGAVVLDPFMGSGSTGIACKNLNRNFIGMELDPEYIKIAEARIGAVEKEPSLF